MIEFRDVCFSYHSHHLALDEVSFSIKEGEFVAILGSNGSGKSTLARHINALLVPESGDVSICGMSSKDPDHCFPIRSRVGMVFQNPDDQIVASVVENEVAFGPENLGIPADEIRERVNEALAFCGLQGFEKRETNALSGGQKQRLAIAGALAMRPQILVLDEATSMLDPLGRSGLMRVVKRQHEKGMTCIMITHSMEEAALCDRIIVMKQGKILADGPREEILTNAELLEQAGLELPFAYALSLELSRLGVPLEPTLRLRDYEEALCQLF